AEGAEGGVIPPNSISEMAGSSSWMPENPSHRLMKPDFQTSGDSHPQFPPPPARFRVGSRSGRQRRARLSGKPRLPEVRTRFGSQITLDKRPIQKMPENEPLFPVLPSNP